MQTCQLLKAAVGCFFAMKGASLTQDGFKEYCIGVGLDAVCTGGAATALKGAVSAYNNATTVVDMARLAMCRTNREKCAFLLKHGFGIQDQADAIAHDMVVG